MTTSHAKAGRTFPLIDRIRLTAVWGATLGIALLTSTLVLPKALAEEEAGEPPPAATGTTDGGNRGTPGVIVLEAEEIRGRIQKPEAFYILQRSSLNYEGLEHEKSLLPAISKSVEEAPF